MVKIYIADSLGSIIAEKAADCMEEELAVFIEKEVGNTLIGIAPVIADGTYRNNKNYSPYFRLLRLVVFS